MQDRHVEQRTNKEGRGFMERARDAVLEHYAALALGSLVSEEGHQLHKMLILVDKSGDLEIELAGVPVGSLDVDSSTAEVKSTSVPTGGRS